MTLMDKSRFLFQFLAQQERVEKMNILVVGAGAVGQVYAWHLAQAGHAVSFFLKEKYVESLRQGCTLHRLGHRRNRQQDFQGFGLVTDLVHLAAQRWDQVWLALSSDALRTELTTGILASVGQATVVCLQPDLEDIDFVRARVPVNQVVQGLITFISFQSPLPGCSGPSGMAYYLPPLAPGLFGGPDSQRVRSVVAGLNVGGMTAKVVPDFARAGAGAPAIMQPLVAALELNQWRLQGFVSSQHFALGLDAAREAMTVANRHVGADVRLLKMLLRPLLWRLLLPVVRQILPFDLEGQLKYHFSKVRPQTLLMLNSYSRLGASYGLPTSALNTLRGQLAELPAA